MKTRPLILITNDDGITAPGLRSLITFMNKIGDVVVVAPDSPQSAMGHAITINNTLFCKKEQIDNGPQSEFSTSGTPADCIKLAINEILDRKPDICVSGINHGSNASINVIYSGTMSAAIEAGIEGIPSVGFSLLDYNWDADFSHCEKYIIKIVKNVLENGLENGIILNVNFPNAKKEDIKGVKICKQAKSYWEENFDKRISPLGKNYYWLTGKFINLDESKDSDQYALERNYISIVPVQFDLAAYKYMDKLKSWNFES